MYSYLVYFAHYKGDWNVAITVTRRWVN